MNRADFIHLLREYGVVGGGGGGFPTYLKFSGKNLTTLIVNGSECEPLLYSDYYLIKFRSGEIVSVIKKIQEIFSLKEVFFVLKEKRRELVNSLMREGIEEVENFKFHFMRDFYPAGDEQVIIKDLKGINIPSIGNPGEYGIVVLNVQTLCFIHNALNNRGVTGRFVTVGGAVKNPSVFDVPIGVRVGDLIDCCGGYSNISRPAIVAGGIMMGKLVGEEYTIKKTTTGIIVLPEDSPVVREKNISPFIYAKKAKSVCDGCMECTFFCSRNVIGKRIRPHLIMRDSIFYLEGIKEIPFEVFNCSGCGLCSLYSCSQGLSPRRVIEYLKGISEKGDVSNYKGEANFDTLPYSKRLMKRLDIEKYGSKIPSFYGIFEPLTFKVSLRQGGGNIPSPIVKEGDFILRGDKIGVVDDGAWGVDLHSPANGSVKSVDGNDIIIEKDLL